MYEDRVKAGIKFLDENYNGNWREKINLDKLDISDHENCVLGQLFVSYLIGIIKFVSVYGYNSYSMGFNDSNSYETKELTKEWKKQLSS